MDVLERAERGISNGNLWRAKEILHQAVGHSGYKSEIYEKLGNVLLQMSDLAEAGKYLFLSGVRKAEYEKAIEIFLQKYEGKSHNLFHPFPRSAKLAKISQYPPTVGDKMREMGLPEELKDVHGNYVNSSVSKENRFALAIFLSIVLAIAVLVILGIIKLLEIIF